MNGSALGAAITSAILTALADYLALNDDENDSHELTGFDQTAFWTKVGLAIGQEVVSHITANGRAIGNDTPSGDAHNLNII